MLYVVLVQRANDKLTTQSSAPVGCTATTYSMINDITGLSRTKISGGLRVLVKLGMVPSKFIQLGDVTRIA